MAADFLGILKKREDALYVTALTTMPSQLEMLAKYLDSSK
jgi:hypothetical protein